MIRNQVCLTCLAHTVTHPTVAQRATFGRERLLAAFGNRATMVVRSPHLIGRRAQCGLALQLEEAI